MENLTNQSNPNSNDGFSGGISFDNITNSLTPGFDDISFDAPTQNQPDTTQQSTSAPSVPTESTGNSGDALSTDNAEAFSLSAAEPAYTANISPEHDDASDEANISANSDTDNASQQSAKKPSDPDLPNAIEIAVQAIVLEEKSTEETIQMLEEKGYSPETASDAVQFALQEKQYFKIQAAQNPAAPAISSSASSVWLRVFCLRHFP